MPRPLKTWLGFVISILLLILIVGYFNSYYAIGIFWSFGHGETSIAWWIKIHVAVWKAIAIAIVCSTITTYGWFYLANDKHSEAFIKKYWDFSPKEAQLNASWYYRWAKKTPYVVLPFFSFIPEGGVWFSIAWSKFFRLNKALSFGLIALGNTWKMISWGIGFNLVMFIYGLAHRHRWDLMDFIIAIVSFKLGSLITLLVHDYVKNKKQKSLT